MSFPLELDSLPNLAKLGAFTDNQTYSKAQTYGALNENEGKKQVDGVATWGGGKGWMILKRTNEKHMLMRFFLKRYSKVVRRVFYVDEMPDALTKIVCFNNDDSIFNGIDFWSCCFEDTAG